LRLRRIRQDQVTNIRFIEFCIQNKRRICGKYVGNCILAFFEFMTMLVLSCLDVRMLGFEFCIYLRIKTVLIQRVFAQLFDCFGGAMR